jgi:hypothetical protein
MAISHFSRGASSSLQPLREICQPDFMLGADIADGDSQRHWMRVALRYLYNILKVHSLRWTSHQAHP